MVRFVNVTCSLVINSFAIALHHLIECWRTTSPTAWDITAYDMYLPKKSYNTKRMSHAKLIEDLYAVQATSPKQVAIQQGIKFLCGSHGKLSRDRDNRTFWETAAVKLNQASCQRDVADAKLMNSAKKLRVRYSIRRFGGMKAILLLDQALNAHHDHQHLQLISQTKNDGLHKKMRYRQTRIQPKICRI
ncbi:hypothetical protein BJV82DRAFT_91606 [Fennellomyces sp. T-0311]|nr:hypothetical protein BJV82DRAFT_91606 [Fennellomyces sp. T-0311]